MSTKAQKDVCEEAGLSCQSMPSGTAAPNQSLVSMVAKIAASKRAPAVTGISMTATEAADVTSYIKRRAKAANENMQKMSCGMKLLSHAQKGVMARNLTKLRELIDDCEVFSLTSPCAAIIGTLRETEDGEELSDLQEAFEGAVRKVQAAQKISGNQQLKQLHIPRWDPVEEEEEEEEE